MIILNRKCLKKACIVDYDQQFFISRSHARSPVAYNALETME